MPRKDRKEEGLSLSRRYAEAQTSGPGLLFAAETSNKVLWGDRQQSRGGLIQFMFQDARRDKNEHCVTFHMSFSPPLAEDEAISSNPAPVPVNNAHKG